MSLRIRNDQQSMNDKKNLMITVSFSLSVWIILIFRNLHYRHNRFLSSNRFYMVGIENGEIVRN